MKLLIAILVVFEIVPTCGGAVRLRDEETIIRRAAERNGCRGEDYRILLAIRKAENGPDGYEFGVRAVKGTNLETQAAWAAATIMKNRKRWTKFGCPGDFIRFLQKRYCPDNEGGRTWLRNVKHFLKEGEKK